MGEQLVGLVLGAVFAGSVLNQLPFRRWQRFVARFDRWTFLPYWAFFAPDPGFAGTHLVYRDQTDDGWTPWSELRIPGPSRWQWAWNPGRFERKALQDLLNGLVRTAAEVKDPVALELTACHLGLLIWVDAQPRLDARSTHRQFAVLQAVGHGTARSLRPVVVSRAYGFD